MNRFVFNQDLTGIRIFKTDDLPEQDALAAAAGAHDDENLTRLNVEADSIEHLVFAEAFSQAPDFNPNILASIGVHHCM